MVGVHDHDVHDHGHDDEGKCVGKWRFSTRDRVLCTITMRTSMATMMRRAETPIW